MERKEKNQISSFLLAVGVVFILIAGSIFVSTAWEYLPENGKKVVLLFVTAGLLAGAGYLSRQESLEKLEKALYYMGTGFAGYTMLALLGGVEYNPISLCWAADTIPSWEYMKVITASLIMFGLLVIRCWKKREGAAFGIALVLIDNCLWWGCMAGGLLFKDFVMAETLLLTTYAAIDYFLNQQDEIQTEWRNLYQIFLAFYVFHAVIIFWGMVIRSIISDYQLGEMSVYMLLFVIISTLVYASRKQTVFRVLNSVLSVGLIYVVVAEVFHSDLLNDWFCYLMPSMAEKIITRGILSDWEMAALAFMLSFGIAIVLGRREIWSAQILVGAMLLYTQPYFEIAQQFQVEWKSLLMVSGIVLLGRIWYDKWEVFRWVQFAVVCRVLVELLWNNLLHGELENVLILGIASLVILVVAAIQNQKEYVIASSVTLLLLAIYLTRSFWLNLEWWVYLFVAGVALIVLAIRKERE